MKKFKKSNKSIDDKLQAIQKQNNIERELKGLD